MAFIASRPDAAGRRAMIRIDKASGRRTIARCAIGRDDPSAGQIHNALLRDGREVGGIHRFNPGMAPPPVRAATPTVTSLTIAGGTGLRMRDGGHEHRFAAGSWRYVVVAPAAGPVELWLLHGGRILRRE